MKSFLFGEIGRERIVAANPVGIGSIDQVAVVVRDLDRVMERYADEFGIGPWSVYTFGPEIMSSMTFRGNEQPYIMKRALANVGDTMYELIEPVQGPNTYEEFLNEGGVGLHHFGYFVDDVDAAIREMEDKGYPLLQSGRSFGVGADTPTLALRPSTP